MRSENERSVSRAERERLGRAVAAERDAGAPWKVLEYRFGMSRMNLWRLKRLAGPGGGKDVTCYISDVVNPAPVEAEPIGAFDLPRPSETPGAARPPAGSRAGVIETSLGERGGGPE